MTAPTRAACRVRRRRAGMRTVPGVEVKGGGKGRQLDDVATEFTAYDAEATR
ncbi:hypothetical protein [Streptomyces acidiscabies]|uniref:hypothetical protein n=1 Tax=Streptomyces acidiscabies TaxID=42234 RepID=UPI00131CA387|nr:hypothetical protein [Streptomyces acidiscabies]